MKTKPSPTPYALVAVDTPAYVIGGPRHRANGFVCSKAPTWREHETTTAGRWVEANAHTVTR
jgi:hypothetical protein